MIEAISPDDIAIKKAEVLPDQVVEIFNKVIAENWNGHKSYFKVKEILPRLANALDCSSDFIFEKHYLDVEDVYKQKGWTVRYEQPCIGDTFDAFFEFTKR